MQYIALPQEIHRGIIPCLSSGLGWCCIRIDLLVFSMESPCHRSDVSLPANLQYNTCACVARFRVLDPTQATLGSIPEADA
jgi:hypothetical protein